MAHTIFVYLTLFLSSLLVYILLFPKFIYEIHRCEMESFDPGVESSVQEFKNLMPELETSVQEMKSLVKECKSLGPEIELNSKEPLSMLKRRTVYRNIFDTKESEWLFDLEANSEWFPEGLIGDNITGYPKYIVPNIVHYVLLDDNQINFVHYLSFKSVLNVQIPDKIMIHCNCDKIDGKYWNKLKGEYEDLEYKFIIRRVEKPKSIFGAQYNEHSHVWHASDVLRNRVLMEFGGIYIDRDVFIIKSLNPFRKFEMSLGYEFDKQGTFMGSMIQIAHKRARFLRLYLQTYEKYDGKRWYWNAGEFPKQRIIDRYPHLVHSLHSELFLTPYKVCPYLYLQNANDWKDKYFAIHALMRGNILYHKSCFEIGGYKVPSVSYYDEEIVKTSNTTFGQIARNILFNNTDIRKI